MSAFVVQDETINRVVTWLDSECASMNGLTYGGVDRVLKTLGYDLRIKADLPRLGQDMFNLNVQAVNERYGPGEAEKFRPLNYKFAYFPHVNNFQALKSLHCWHYQCSDGNVPDMDLYRAFESIAHAIECGIVSRLPAYEAAKWD